MRNSIHRRSAGKERVTCLFVLNEIIAFENNRKSSESLLEWEDVLCKPYQHENIMLINAVVSCVLEKLT